MVMFDRSKMVRADGVCCVSEEIRQKKQVGRQSRNGRSVGRKVGIPLNIFLSNSVTYPVSSRSQIDSSQRQTSKIQIKLQHRQPLSLHSIG